MDEFPKDLMPKNLDKKNSLDAEFAEPDEDNLPDFLKVVKGGENKSSHVSSEKKISLPAKPQQGVGHWIVGVSPTIGRLRQMIVDIADTGADVLIMGETGTGKELVARSLHDQSRRWKNQFVPLNCCALPESIMESELFGHEMGAFTGADRRRIGKFEFANGGTIFLDEIDSMPVHLQAKLLRVLQERVVQRVGSNETISLDVRVVAATKVDLKEACAGGQFREDLFYRLNVVNIDLSPLRDRREDIPLLFRYFVLQACSRYRRSCPEFPENLLQELMTQPWPGNVRELKNAAERYVLGFFRMESENMDPGQGLSSPAHVKPVRQGRMTLPQQVQAFEKVLIEETLSRYRGDIKATHAALGLPRKTLYDKMRKYGLRRKNYL